MLKEVILIVDNVSSGISVVSNLVTFVGGFYIALHSRMIPKWMTTCLWYIGLASLLNAITHIVEWVWDSMHPLSHFQIGSFTEVLMTLSLGITIGMLFFHTIWKDFIGARKRQAVEARVDAKAQEVKKAPVKKAAPVKAAVKKAPVAKKAVKSVK